MSRPTNQQVINSFMKGQQCMGANLWSTGTKLCSYQTCIAQWDNVENRLIINKTKYSMTTSSKHQSPLYRAISNLKGVEVVEVKGCQFGVSDLSQFINKEKQKDDDLRI